MTLLVAAPDSTAKARAAADVVLGSAPADTLINTATTTATGRVELAAGTYKLAAPLVRRTGVEFVGEGEDTCVAAGSSWNGAPGIFSTAPGAHYTRVAHMRIDGAGRAQSAAYADSGKPDSAAPPTSPDSWHRHDHLIVHGCTGSAFASLSGTDGIREGWIVNCLVLGDFAWNGSDLYVDGFEVRNNRSPVVLGGGNTRAGVVKVFYSESSVAVRVSSSRLIASLIEVQDAANHGLDVASADCLIGALRIDSAGRSTPNGDALLINASGAMLPAVQIIDRGANAYRTRNGIVANAAGGAIIDAQVGAGITGATYTGPAINAMAGLRVNGRQIVPAQTAVSADLTALVARIAALEAAGANTDTSLRAVDAAIADLDNRVDALDALIAARATAAANTLPALDAAIAQIASTAPKSRIALGYARDAIAKSVGA